MHPPRTEQDPAVAEIVVQQPSPLLAPWWHTVLVCAVIAAVSLQGLTRRSQAHMAEHHLAEYSLTLAWEWLLLALTLGGIWLRSRSFRLAALSGEGGLSARAWLGDVRAALLFWIGSTFALGLVGLLLKLARVDTPQPVLTGLAPRDAQELALFLLLSLTAGFCEELIFRGYLMEQCTRLAALATGRRAAWTGAVASSVLFGAAHLYEGVSGVAAITIFGLLFAWLALKRRSLRAGMMAHAWHDAVSGLVLFLLARTHAI